MLGEFLAAFGQLSLTLDKQKGELVLLSFKHSLLLLEGMGIDSHFCEVCEEKRGEYLVENKGILCCDCKADQAGMEVGDLIPLLLQLEEPMQIVRRRNPLPQASFLRVKKMVETLFLQRTGLQLLSEKMLMH
jgi:hypothetical protein